MYTHIANVKRHTVITTTNIYSKNSPFFKTASLSLSYLHVCVPFDYCKIPLERCHGNTDN